MGRILGTLAIVVAVAACGGGDDADAGATLACGHFRNVASDYTDGLLTADELRGKLQEVHDDAKLSDEPGVADAGREMLAAVTAGDEAALASAVRSMGAACDTAGL